ncbi:MAG: carbon-nitrogen hydrolase family protein [Gemmatimonadetes bacterium]|jgi:predicted amidohydrolase|nr:carbon-nitrogen hydrolase family protein [Gemmatimonadota bacterium]
MRIGALQPGVPIVDYHIEDPEQALVKMEEGLDLLAEHVRQAGREGCDAVALTEDTPGLHKWLAVFGEKYPEVLPRGVEMMLGKLGEAAANQNMYLVCCSDSIGEDGAVYNTSFFVGRDGKEIGRYLKANMPYSELGGRSRGPGYPVFETPDLGGVGMLICYDMVFPEPIRCLGLGGADIVFVPTMGAAAMADGELSRTAFRVRAVDNFVYMVVAFRGGGSMVISPKGDILAEGGGPLVCADVDPFGGREGGNAYDWQRDMRARLFRERAPETYDILTAPEPPALTKLPTEDTPEEVTRRANGVMTVGADGFDKAQELMDQGKKEEAIQAFGKLREDFPTSWIDRVAQERLKEIRGE